jgi:ABC-type multidrug transport system fused ATPase/permease subunit
VRKLPDGYRTPLGRAGGKLSVGQKQRLAIARGLVRRARVLILDEPTSALDPETEQVLVESLREASRDRVVFVIAHRLSTVRSADLILVLADGAIIERGSHHELMARPDGAYRRFVSLQTQGAA